MRAYFLQVEKCLVRKKEEMLEQIVQEMERFKYEACDEYYAQFSEMREQVGEVRSKQEVKGVRNRFEVFRNDLYEVEHVKEIKFNLQDIEREVDRMIQNTLVEQYLPCVYSNSINNTIEEFNPQTLKSARFELESFPLNCVIVPLNKTSLLLIGGMIEEPSSLALSFDTTQNLLDHHSNLNDTYF